jgi:phosphate transport system permease protein
MAETAPLFLTAGLSSISTIGLLNPGQTLTTRIYAQIFSNNLSGANDISYECAFVAFIIILAIIYIGYGIIPIYKD